MLLFEKSNPIRGDVSVKTKNGQNGDHYKTYNVASSKSQNSFDKNYESLKIKNCIICQKTDHVPTVTNRGNLIINYFACDKFVNVTEREI